MTRQRHRLNKVCRVQSSYLAYAIHNLALRYHHLWKLEGKVDLKKERPEKTNGWEIEDIDIEIRLK